MKLSKIWPFKNSHPTSATSEATHHLTSSFTNEGIYYGVEPELVDWSNQCMFFGADASSVSLLNQCEELGHIIPLDNQLFLSWNSFYRLLADVDENSNELLKLLKLPEFTDLRPSLVSQGSS